LGGTSTAMHTRRRFAAVLSTRKNEHSQSRRKHSAVLLLPCFAVAFSKYYLYDLILETSSDFRTSNLRPATCWLSCSVVADFCRSLPVLRLLQFFLRSSDYPDSCRKSER